MISSCRKLNLLVYREVLKDIVYNNVANLIEGYIFIFGYRPTFVY